jgi:hypothetical protein
MLAMSIEHAKPDAAHDVIEVMGSAARATWRSAHFTNLALGHVKIMLFSAILLRFALVPRPLAAVLVMATLLSTSAAVLSLLGRSFAYWMVAPTGLLQLAMTLWLLARGFRGRSYPGMQTT